MINKFKVFTILLFLIIVFKLQAQTSQSFIKEKTNKADLVIQGNLVERSGHWDNDRKMIITANKFRVEKLYKGFVKDTIITVETLGGQVNDDLIIISHQPSLLMNQSAVLFLESKGTEQFNFTLNSEDPYWIIHEKQITPFCVINKQSYPIQNIENEIILASKQPVLSYDMIAKLKNLNIGLRGACENSFSIRGEEDPELYLSFENIRLSDDFQYVDFDIMCATSDNGYALTEGEIYLTFSSESLIPLNSVTKGLIAISKGRVLENEVYSTLLADISENQFKIGFTSSTEKPEKLYRITTVKEKLLTVKVKITEIGKIDKIKFETTKIEGTVKYYCNGNVGPFKTVKTSPPIKAVSPTQNPVSITYTFENFFIDKVNLAIKFDIYAKASQNTYLKDAQIAFQYNHLNTFQANQIAKSQTFSPYISINRGELITDPTAYNLDYNDAEDPTFVYNPSGAIIIIIESQGTNLTELGNTPKRLLSISLKLIDCKGKMGLKFYEAEMKNRSSYSTTAVPPFGATFYSPVIANDIEDYAACGCEEPVISSFTPTSIPAGTGDVLTIKGSNFGIYDGFNSLLEFPDADQGTTSVGTPIFMKAGNRDFFWDKITHWSDNEIQVKVPSTDRGDNTGKKPAGSGKFRVTNSCGKRSLSNTKLSIPYALINIRETPSSEAKPAGLACTNVLKFHKDLSSFSTTGFKNAVLEWNAKISPNFRISSDMTTAKNNPDDGINSVYPGTPSSGSQTGAGLNSSFSYYKKCTKGYLLKDIDIVINESTLTNTNLIYGACLHELGHSLGLNHSLLDDASQNLMYASKSFTNNTIIEPEVVSTADLIFGTSNTIVLAGGCDNIQPIVKNSTCGVTSIEKEIISNGVSFYPNPVLYGNDIYVNSSIPCNGKVMNLLGQEVIRVHITEGTNRIPTYSLGKGIFFIVLEDELTSKIIAKQKLVIQ